MTVLVVISFHNSPFYSIIINVIHQNDINPLYFLKIDKKNNQSKNLATKHQNRELVFNYKYL
jgi:hypothetical protein